MLFVTPEQEMLIEAHVAQCAECRSTIALALR
jgi:hypothetical protein